MTSTRPLEQACRENVTFMILAGHQTPDHRTIASFVSSIDREVKERHIMGESTESQDKETGSDSKEDKKIFS
jgi:transposase